MTTGTGGRLVAAVVGAALVAVAPVPRATAEAPAAADASVSSPDDVLARFRGLSGLEARFHEEKVIGLLAAPLVSDGTIHFMAPRRVARHTLSPRRSSFVIDGSQMTFWDDRRVQRLEVGTSPVAAAFVDTFASLLSGDRVALERAWRLETVPVAAPAWELVLRPRVEGVARVISTVRVRGRDASLSSLVIEEATGDRTATTFSDVVVGKRYTAEEAARVFRVPG